MERRCSGQFGANGNPVGSARLPPLAVVQVAERAYARSAIGLRCSPWAFLRLGGWYRALRESFRRLLHSTIQPLARIVQEELSAKLDGEVKLSLDSMHRTSAADLSAAVSGFSVNGERRMSVEKAAALAGLTGE